MTISFFIHDRRVIAVSFIFVFCFFWKLDCMNILFYLYCSSSCFIRNRDVWAKTSFHLYNVLKTFDIVYQITNVVQRITNVFFQIINLNFRLQKSWSVNWRTHLRRKFHQKRRQTLKRRKRRRPSKRRNWGKSVKSIRKICRHSKKFQKMKSLFASNQKFSEAIFRFKQMKPSHT